MTTKELIEILKQYPDDTEVVSKQWVQRWSGNPEDTDLSEYVKVPATVEVCGKVVVIAGVDTY